MMKRILFGLAVMLCCIFFTACDIEGRNGNAPISKDPATIAKGELVFNQHCSGCHNFRQDGIGPQLGGLTTKVSSGWIYAFIKEPQSLINSGDDRAKQLYGKYKTVMPSFVALGDTGLNAVIAFLHKHSLPESKISHENGQPLSNPIPEVVAVSDLVATLTPLTQFPSTSEAGKLPRARITKLDYQPGSGKLFVVDQRGTLYRLQENRPSIYLDLARLKPKFIDQPGFGSGFGSFAFHPQFASNGLFYTTHTESPGSGLADFSYADSIKVTLQWVLTEWKATDPEAGTFSGTNRELMRVNMVAPNHGVQEITFNPLAGPGSEDYQLLYIGIGDGGSVENGYVSLVNAPLTVWGTILRVDPTGRNSRNRKYGIPETNPFADNPNKNLQPEIYAYGFRNPHRITWSRSRGMLVSNIGHGNIEALDMVEKAHNYGWPEREGSFLINPHGEMNKVYPLPGGDSIKHINYPVAEYDHDEGKAISGGYEYSGNDVPGLKEKFLFGDIPTGRLLFVDIIKLRQGSRAPVMEWRVAVNGKIKTLVDLCGSKRVDLHFGKDSRGELYIMTKADGRLYKITGLAPDVNR